MRGLRPRSPRTTVVTRIRSRSHEEPNIPRWSAPTAASRRRLLIVVGPTAGHVYPALAIADAWHALDSHADVAFAGSLEGPAARLLGARGFRLAVVSGSQLVNTDIAGKLVAVPRALVGMAQARRLLRTQQARLVIGLGGYSSGAILLTARTVGAGVVIHEANVQPGVANRLLAPFAHRVHLGFAAGAAAFAARKSVVTGHPVRADIAALATEARTAPARTRPARVLVLSSTRGEAFLATRVPALLAEVERRGLAMEVLHQSGDVTPGDLAHAYRRVGVKATVAPYLDEIASAYRWADLVIARAGAGTIAESAAAGVPSLLVPLGDASGDHQAANAVAVATAGAGLAVREGEWQGNEVAARVSALLEPPAWSTASRAARALAVPDAAARIVADCEQLMAGRW